MELPAERVERLFQLGFIESELSRQIEESEVINARRDRLNLSANCAKVRATGLSSAVKACARRISLSIACSFSHSILGPCVCVLCALASLR
jgi:hypothetical protein